MALEALQRELFQQRSIHPNAQTFVVIDEAHNLVPSVAGGNNDADRKARERCRQAIVKIAAEGRKYGVFLVLVSQSPSKIHPDALSQCANLIIMRMTTRKDIETIADLRTDVPEVLIRRVAHFRLGEALFIGDFVPATVTGQIVGRITQEGGGGG